MSRVYNALKQATRSYRAAEDDTPAEKLLDLLGVETGGISPISAPVHDSVQRAANPQPDIWQLAPEQSHTTAASRVRDFGTPAKIDVDQKARLIPNVPDHAVVEHYRRLRTKLMQQRAAKPFQSLVVTSANPQEGKTVTTLNLALSFAMLPSFRVVVIDGDLRRGTLGKWLGVKEHPGLSNLIEGTSSLNDVVLRCEQIPIHFIVSGNSTLPAAELLHSPDFGIHIRSMTEQFDLVLVDSPPVNLITDTQLLASYCDAVLVVARAFSTRCKAFEKMTQDRAPFRIVGAVLNGGTRADLYRGYGSYY